MKYTVAMWHRKSTQVWEFSKELGEHMIKFHPQNIRDIFTLPHFFIEIQGFWK